jgi:peroxiredoxin (alkyl hydroperoxide reductase subunit C)
MLGVGAVFPTFHVKATAALPLKDITIDNVFIDIHNKSYPGKWLVVFFYPKDFTFVCPTEIAAFGALEKEFAERDAQFLGRAAAVGRLG